MMIAARPVCLLSLETQLIPLECTPLILIACLAIVAGEMSPCSNSTFDSALGFTFIGVALKGPQ
jgi:hypothetical protein